MKKIDIIIPSYKSQEFLHKALASIALQTVADNIRVTVVLDGEPFVGHYQFILYDFERYFELEFIKLKENGGPAVARQYGLDRTSCPYVMFLDADDTLAGAYAVEMLLKKLEDDESVVLVGGTFYEKRQDMSFVKHENDMTWLHGKMYRRSFLDKHQIRFNDTRANEDVGFNTKIKLLETETERIAFLPNLVYYWHWNESGITRINNFEYTLNQSYFGYVENQIDAIMFAHKIVGNEKFLLGYALEVLANIYIYILRIRWKNEEKEPQAFEFATRYFDEVITKLDVDVLTNEEHQEIITVSIANQISHLHGYIIDMTFFEFLNILMA